MSKKIGVLLSGCGVYDGAEVHESVLTLLAIAHGGAQAVCIAPDKAQAHVINHLTGDVAAGESRNVRVEAARIARGDVLDLAAADAAQLDALILPGGFGAAKNLCNYAFAGEAMEVDPDVARLVRAMHAQRKPIGFICIAPVIAAKLLGNESVQVTIGDDAATAGHIKSWGACHVAAKVEKCVADQKNNVFSAPAYMLGPTIDKVNAGISRLVEAILQRA